MVEGYFHVRNSALLTEGQKNTVEKKLATRVNSEGSIQVKSQVHRSQLGNKKEVIRKMQVLLEKALTREKRRIPTRPTAGSKEKRIEHKKKKAETKERRKRIPPNP
jgi:ribosome-associated protein